MRKKNIIFNVFINASNYSNKSIDAFIKFNNHDEELMRTKESILHQPSVVLVL